MKIVSTNSVIISVAVSFFDSGSFPPPPHFPTGTRHSLWDVPGNHRDTHNLQMPEEPRATAPRRRADRQRPSLSCWSGRCTFHWPVLLRPARGFSGCPQDSVTGAGKQDGGARQEKGVCGPGADVITCLMESLHVLITPDIPCTVLRTTAGYKGQTPLGAALRR